MQGLLLGGGGGGLVYGRGPWGFDKVCPIFFLEVDGG